MKLHTVGALVAVALLAACANQEKAASTGTGAHGPAMTGPAPGSEEDLVANVGDRVFFDFNKSNLKQEARATLDRQAAWMAKYPQVDVQVAGNCDERGTEEYNLALGQRRANSAAQYLEAKGVQSARIHTISYGKERPTCTAHTEQCWAQNRNAITSVH